ncbi:sulfur oxidation c-type cytochrome SoxX [Sinisalibacter lacisalsi]|uniref:Sulfur oxidation c-type cytochrome SoxX n=1 Tax=Sinisalibacter lacisalsi TaxID=1526570 RepID=A0ABQ1Q9W5_9RHOB|nr:sulfur oxidation c-type cytochrome SoxX [Sinisalibacter lacisalsi]GGD20460.1 sulfur oxidation c-type cytochrome SoxX [Sinisalibacter lacisalsi]
MRTLFALCAAAATAFPAILSAETAPTEVSFSEYGEVFESLTGVPGDPEEGYKSAVSRGAGNCVACHTAQGWSQEQFPGDVGPELTGVGARYEPAQIRGILVNAKHTFPETVMPAFYNVSNLYRPGDGYTGKAAKSPDVTVLTAQQIEDILALLLTFTEE